MNIFIKHSNFWVAVMFIAIGLFCGMQYSKAEADRAAEENERDTTADVVAMLNDEYLVQEGLENQIEEYNLLLDKYERQLFEESSVGVDTISSEYNQARLTAGFAEVSGEGLIITVDDGDVPAGSVNPNIYLVHEMTLIRILNVLKTSGAEAISIQGERFIGYGGILCNGSVLCINNKRFAPPYEIKVIGNAEKLYEDFTNSSLIGVFININELKIKAEKSENLTISGYSNSAESLISFMQTAEVQK